MHSMRLPSFFGILTFFRLFCVGLVVPAGTSSLFAEDPSLSEVLVELRALREEVAALTARVDELEATRQATHQVGSVSSEIEPEEPNFLDRLTDQLARRQEANGDAPWLMPASWDALKKGMSSEEVIALLGDPTYDEPSLNRRVDRVFTYRGKNFSTGKRVTGKVRFENDKVVNFELPEF